MTVESLKRLANRRGYALKMVNEKLVEALKERDTALARVAALEAERDAYQENSEMMNDAASRYLRRAEQAEAQFKEPPSRDYHNEIREERDKLREALKVAREALETYLSTDTDFEPTCRTALAQIDKLIGGGDAV